MFCKNCGNEIKSEKFCPACGTKVEEEKKEQETVVQEVTESNDTSPITVVGSSNSNNNTSNSTQSQVSGGYSEKSKIAAGLLGIFLGMFGVHNFYLGYIGKAVAQLLISVLSCGILAIVSEIWGLVEGIMILCADNYKDAKGNILRN